MLRRCIETLLPSLPAWIPAVLGQVFGDISSTGPRIKRIGLRKSIEQIRRHQPWQ